MKLRILIWSIIGLSAVLLVFNKHVDKLLGPAKYNGIVRLVNLEGDTFCTGFVVSDTRVITAGHCALMQEMSIVDKDLKFSTKGKFKFVNANSMHSIDVATIEGEFSEFEPLEVDFSNDVKMGAKVTSAGYGLGGPLHVSSGVVVGFLNFFIQTKDLNLIQGMSGGPMIDVESGKVMGINSRVDEVSQQFTPMINLDTFTGL